MKIGATLEPNQPSMTARLCAVLRAVHLLADGEPKILNDTLARSLSGIADDDGYGARSDYWNSPKLRELRGHMVVRSRYAEDWLTVEFSAKSGQYVILGAGLDSFAHRRQKALKHIQVFEVDHPSTQQWKQEQLAIIGYADSPNVHFVPVDMEVEKFSEKLYAAGFDSDKPTLFTLLSVSLYLTREAMEAMAAEVLGCASGYCQLIMNSALPVESLSQEDRDEMIRVAKRSAEVGEPWLSYYSPGQLEDLLSESGFTSFEHLGATQAMSLYFTGRDDGFRPSRAYHLISAVRE